MTRRFLVFACTVARDERGQDLVEYALLTAFIGIASVAAWALLSGTLGTYYEANDTRTQGIYVTPDPLPSTP